MIEVFKKVFNLDFYGQSVSPVNPPAGSARMFYDSATDEIVVVDSTGKNLIGSGTFAGTRVIVEQNLASILDFYGQQAAPENPSTGLARAYYDSSTDDFAVIDSEGAVLLGTGSALSGRDIEVSSKVQIIDFLGIPGAPSNPPAGFARMYYDSNADTFNVIDSVGKSLLSQAPPFTPIQFLTAVTTEINNTTNGTSAPIDTTGANLLVVSLGSFFATPAFTDSKNNTWVALTAYLSSGTFSYAQLFYCINPVVGTGHTISVTGGTQTNAVMAAFSGALPTAGVFQTGTDKGNGAGSTPVQPGSVIPLHVGDVIITGLSAIGDSIGSVICDSGFTVIQQATTKRWDTCLAYLIVTDVEAFNPTWNDATGTFATANIAIFSVA